MSGLEIRPERKMMSWLSARPESREYTADERVSRAERERFSRAVWLHGGKAARGIIVREQQIITKTARENNSRTIYTHHTTIISDDD